MCYCTSLPLCVRGARIETRHKKRDKAFLSGCLVSTPTGSISSYGCACQACQALLAVSNCLYARALLPSSAMGVTPIALQVVKN